MSVYLHALRQSLLGLALLGASGMQATCGRRVSRQRKRSSSVRHMLERLPYYGVFDYIVFRVDRGVVYLAGYSFEGRLKARCGDGREARERRR